MTADQAIRTVPAIGATQAKRKEKLIDLNRTRAKREQAFADDVVELLARDSDFTTENSLQRIAHAFGSVGQSRNHTLTQAEYERIERYVSKKMSRLNRDAGRLAAAVAAAMGQWRP
jgi:hypothetical protein